MRPLEEALQRLDTIPSVGRRAVEQLVAEIGTDMSRFPTAGHLASWAHVCPGNIESAGKRKVSSTGSGNPWLRSALAEGSGGAARAHQTYLSAQYHRLAARRGGKRAVVAISHSILVIVYHLLYNGTVHQELGANYFDEHDRRAAIRRTVQRIERLIYKVTVGVGGPQLRESPIHNIPHRREIKKVIRNLSLAVRVGGGKGQPMQDWREVPTRHRGGRSLSGGELERIRTGGPSFRAPFMKELPYRNGVL